MTPGTRSSGSSGPAPASSSTASRTASRTSSSPSSPPASSRTSAATPACDGHPGSSASRARTRSSSGEPVTVAPAGRSAVPRAPSGRRRRSGERAVTAGGSPRSPRRHGAAVVRPARRAPAGPRRRRSRARASPPGTGRTTSCAADQGRAPSPSATSARAADGRAQPGRHHEQREVGLGEHRLGAAAGPVRPGPRQIDDDGRARPPGPPRPPRPAPRPARLAARPGTPRARSRPPTSGSAASTAVAVEATPQPRSAPASAAPRPAPRRAPGPGRRPRDRRRPAGRPASRRPAVRASAAASVLAPAPPQLPPTATSQPRSTSGARPRRWPGRAASSRRPGSTTTRSAPMATAVAHSSGVSSSAGHDHDPGPPRQPTDHLRVEHVGTDQDQRGLPVRATQGGTAGRQLRLGAGSGQQPQHVVEQPLVGADDEGPAGRCGDDRGGGTEKGHAGQVTGRAGRVADLDEICG